MRTLHVAGRRRWFLACFALGLTLAGSLGEAQGQDKPSSDDSAVAKPAAKRGRRPPVDPHAPWGQNVRDDGSYLGRAIAPVMSYLGADWLIRPEREIEEEPERMLDALKLEPGMTVADIGGGSVSQAFGWRGG